MKKCDEQRRRQSENSLKLLKNRLKYQQTLRNQYDDFDYDYDFGKYDQRVKDLNSVNNYALWIVLILLAVILILVLLLN
jgi:hypothetical protein